MQRDAMRCDAMQHVATRCSTLRHDATRRSCRQVGKLSIVDLAGSERIKKSGSTGQRLTEAKSINVSLLTLGCAPRRASA
jgi:hypothetical protein